ncbi:MAG TPA: HxsD-like protein [Candidatus Paceibacterota bacterium]|nr:HxsD-like protein [Candidatus Paceibacterota bacterium]HPR91154.1 HxsD-like protein [Candidatus Paceibacterota bacterium]
MTINFNKEIYTVQSVKAAIAAYKGIAVFTLEEKKKFIVVNLKSKKNTKDTPLNLKEEFCNYVLSEIRS